MNIKKSYLLIACLSLIILSMSFVQAQFSESDFRNAGKNIIDWTKGIFGPFFEAMLGVQGFEELFWAKILLLVLMYVFIVLVLDKIPLFEDKKGVSIIVAAIVSILGVRYIDKTGLVNFILMPQGVLAIAMLTIFPFILYFWFVYKTITGGVGRRLAWVFFVVLFLGLWWNSREKLGEYNWIYWVVIGIVALFVLFDGQIHEYFGINESKKARKILLEERIASLNARLGELVRGGATDEATKNTIKRYKKEIDYVYRQLSRL